jgi:hypothetical protein
MAAAMRRVLAIAVWRDEIIFSYCYFLQFKTLPKRKQPFRGVAPKRLFYQKISNQSLTKASARRCLTAAATHTTHSGLERMLHDLN